MGTSVESETWTVGWFWRFASIAGGSFVKSFARVVKIAFLVDTIVCSELFFESSLFTFLPQNCEWLSDIWGCSVCLPHLGSNHPFVFRQLRTGSKQRSLSMFQAEEALSSLVQTALAADDLWLDGLGDRILCSVWVKVHCPRLTLCSENNGTLSLLTNHITLSFALEPIVGRMS